MKNRRKQSTSKQDATYMDFLLLYQYCRKGVQNDLIERLRNQPRPDFLCGKEVPKDLNSLSYGILDDLRTATEEKDPVGECAKVLLGIEPYELATANVNDVFGFANFATKELERINNLFKSIKVHYSQEEIAAGIKELDFGSFGVLDWYARRMGITNQNEVRSVAWIRIFTCMKNDCLRNDFERKLSEQFKKKTQRRKKK